MSKLHILLLPAYYPAPDMPVTGPFMRDLAHALSRTHDVTVLAPWSSASEPLEVDGPVRVVRLPTPKRRGRVDTVQRLWALHQLLRHSRNEGRRVDLIHAHYFATGPSAVLVGGLHRLPVVITENATTCLENAFTAYQAQLARFSYRRARFVCCDSPLHERCLRALEPRARYTVVPPVVDIDAFAASKPQHREGASLHVIAVANLELRKGLDYLIEATRSLIAEGRDLVVTIVGEGPERASLEAQAEGMPVRFVGSRSRAEVQRLLRGADAFALPSLADTFGVSPIEAMAAGVPVVVTSAAGCAELIGPLGARVVAPRDAVALGHALAEILDNAIQVPTDAAQKLRSYCGPQAVGERLDAIYRSAVDSA